MIDSTEISIINAIRLFEYRAEFLILLLANKFYLDLNNEDPFGLLILRDNNLWKGNLNNEWKYHFHGDACTFRNKVNGQVVDVKINRKGNYGVITIFYLFKFIETTDELNELYETVGNESNLNKLIRGLEKSKFIINIDDFPVMSMVLNHDLIKSYDGDMNNL